MPNDRSPNEFPLQSMLARMTGYYPSATPRYNDAAKMGSSPIKQKKPDFLDLDGFIEPESMQPSPSWTIDESLGIYQAPVAYPGDEETDYAWNEETQSWDLITEQNGGT